MKKIRHNGLMINNAYKNGRNILSNNSILEKIFDVVEVEVYKIIFDD